jgi:hypothetical protein
MKSALFASNTPSRDDDAKLCVAVHSVVWIVPVFPIQFICVFQMHGFAYGYIYLLFFYILF